MEKNKKNQGKQPDNGPSSKSAPEKPPTMQIELDKIDIGEVCLRKNPEEELDLLAESIESLGLVQFPVVRPKPNGRYELVCGLRRYSAHKHLNKKTILCRVMDVDPLEAALIALAENSRGARKPVDPLQEADLLREIQSKSGLSEAKIGERIGYKQSTVAERLGLKRLPKNILERIDNGPKSRFRYSQAVELSKMEQNRFSYEAEVDALLNKIITISLSSAELRKLVQLINEGHYDRLPEPIKTLLWNSKSMTSEMARLFLYPEEFIECDGQEGEILRRMATELNKKEREAFINTAVKENLSLDQTKTKLIKLLRHRIAKLAHIDQEPPQCASAAQALYSELSSLVLTLEQQHYQSSYLAESKTEDIDKLCKVAHQIIHQLQSIVRKIKETRKEDSKTKK